MNGRDDLSRHRTISPTGSVINDERSVIIGGTLTAPLAPRNCHDLSHFIADLVPSGAYPGTTAAAAVLMPGRRNECQQ